MSAIGVRRAAASVLDVLDAQLRRADPAACAVRAGAGETTWRELDGRAWAVAAALAARGIAAGRFVPVLAARSGALVAGWIGVLRAGAAYAPLSLDTPPHRVGHVLAELGAGVVLVDRPGEALLGDLRAKAEAVRIDELPEGAPGERVAPRASSPAVVIYTSGTSGRPKGVIVLHRGLLNTALWWADDVDVEPADRVLCTWATGFDGATHEAFRSLLAGAELVFADDVERRDPRALAALLRGPRGATLTSMTPSLLRGVLDVDAGGPTTLRTLYVGGEALPARLAEECFRRWGVPIRNIYGPTEASCISTVCPVSLADGQPPAIGVPLPNTRAYVVGPDLEELPAGVPGELYVAGTGVAHGYLAQPGLTADAFVPDPYVDGGGARMYRTGDRVVLRADGLIEHLGRVDDQVKILGNRIEPNEVRELLEEQPAVRAAAVHAVGDPLRLEAFVELAGAGELPTRDEVVGPLLRWLPPAVLPADVFVVDALPMTGNDKIDFRALAGMRSARLPDAPAEPVELSPDERLAAELFEAALAGGHRIRPAAAPAPSANFFMLGGHSLLAVRLLAEAERRGRGRVAMRDFLAEPTVAGLGRLLGRGGEAAPAAAVQERHPASSAQQRFWFLDRIPSLRQAYLIPTVLELTGPVDRTALAAATAAVLARHPALRSRFELDRKLRQVFVRTDGPAPEVARVDADGWSDAELHEHLAAACWSPLDLAGGTPVRAEVIAAGERTVLLLVVHHIVSDGWSLGLLLDQVAEVYRATLEGRDPDLPPPVHPSRLIDPPAAASVEARIAALAGAPTDVPLPHDRARGAEQSTAAATVVTALGAAVAGRLRGLADELGVTPFMIAAALLAVALARRTGQRDLLLAFPWAGRDAPGSADAVGMLVNTLVLRADLRDEPTWRELLGRVRAASIACFQHAGVPFDAVAAALHPGRDLSRPPLTPVYLDVRDRPHATPDLGTGVAARWRPLDPLHVKFELELTATAGAAGWELAASYPVALFDAGTAAGLLDAVAAAAADLTDDPDARPLGRLP